MTPNFVFLPWILHNRYYHNIHWEMMRMIAMFHLHFLSTSSILEWLINNVKDFLLKLGMKSQIVLRHLAIFFHSSQIEAKCHFYWFDMNKSDNITFYSHNGWVFKVIQAVSVVIWMDSEQISPVCYAWSNPCLTGVSSCLARMPHIKINSRILSALNINLQIWLKLACEIVWNLNGLWS